MGLLDIIKDKANKALNKTNELKNQATSAIKESGAKDKFIQVAATTKEFAIDAAGKASDKLTESKKAIIDDVKGFTGEAITRVNKLKDQVEIAVENYGLINDLKNTISKNDYIINDNDVALEVESREILNSTDKTNKINVGIVDLDQEETVITSAFSNKKPIIVNQREVVEKANITELNLKNIAIADVPDNTEIENKYIEEKPNIEQEQVKTDILNQVPHELQEKPNEVLQDKIQLQDQDQKNINIPVNEKEKTKEFELPNENPELQNINDTLKLSNIDSSKVLDFEHVDEKYIISSEEALREDLSNNEQIESIDKAEKFDIYNENQELLNDNIIENEKKLKAEIAEQRNLLKEKKLISKKATIETIEIPFSQDSKHIKECLIAVFHAIKEDKRIETLKNLKEDEVITLKLHSSDIILEEQDKRKILDPIEFLKEFSKNRFATREYPDQESIFNDLLIKLTNDLTQNNEKSSE
jgi:hypothetical protein